MPIPPPWEEVQDQFRQAEPNGDMEQWRRRYEAMRAVAIQRAATSGESESAGQYLARRSIPFVSSVVNLGENRFYSQALDRVNSGNPSHEDIQTVADYQNQQQHEQNRGLAGDIGSSLAHIPAIVGEALAGGAALRGIGIGASAAAEAPTLLGRAAAAVTSPAAWGRNAAMTAVMPSMWAPQWTQSNIESGRDALDPRGLPSAYVMGFMNTAVLGSLRSGSSITGQGIGSAARRIVARTAGGMLEQQGVDVIASAISEVLPEAYKLETGYGLVGGIVRGARSGNWNPVFRQAVTQAVTFGAFSVMHGADPKEVSAELKTTMDGMHEQGLTQEQAAVELQRRYGPLEQRGQEAAQGLPPVEPLPAGQPQGPATQGGGMPNPQANQPLAPEHPSVLEARRMTQGIPEGTLPPDQVQSSFGNLEGIRTAPEAQPGPETPVQTQTPVQAKPEAVAGQPATPAPMPAAEQRTGEKLRELLKRVDESYNSESESFGDKVGRDEIANTILSAPELAGREQDILRRRFNGDPLEAIGKDYGLSRERVRQLESGALGKLGLNPDAKQSVNKLFVASAKAEFEARAIENGQRVSLGDLKADPLDIAAKTGARQQARDAFVKRTDEIIDNMMEEKINGTLTEEKAAAYLSEINARNNAYKSGQFGEAGTPQEVQQAPGGTPGQTPAARRGRARRGSIDISPIRDIVRGAIEWFNKPAPEPDPVVSSKLQKLWADDAGSIEPWLGLDKVGERMKLGLGTVVNFWKQLKQQQFPQTASISEPVADAMSRKIAAPLHAKEAAPVFFEQIFGDVAPEQARKEMAVILEGRRRLAIANYNQKAAELHQQAQDPSLPDHTKKELIARSAEFSNIARQVGTGVGSPELPTEQEFHRLWTSDRIQEIVNKKGRESGYADFMDDQYRKLKGLEHDAEIETLSQLPNFPFYARALKEGEVAHDFTPGIGSGNTKNQQARGHGSLLSFEGTGQNYELDPLRVIENSIVGRASVVATADLYRTAINQNVGDKPFAFFARPGLSEEGYRPIDNARPSKNLNLAEEGKTTLYVKSESYQNFRDALRLNERFSKLPGANILNSLTLASISEAISHFRNQSTALFAPGLNPIRVAENFKRHLSGDAEFKQQLLDLTKIGATKPSGYESETTTINNLPPLKWTSKAIDVTDRVMRVSLSEAFDNLVKRGDMKNTEANRRNFINAEMGNYHRDGQARVIQWLRDSGVGPFATAATTFMTKGVRSLAGGYGGEATSAAASLRLRAERIGKMAVVLAAAPALNILINGRWDGDDNTPIGAVKTGVDANGKTAYIDLASITGLRRGARMVGLNALLEGSRYGAGPGDIADQGVRDFFRGATAPAAGPIREFGNIMMTGEDMRGAKVAPTVERGNSQQLANFATALIHANPLIEAGSHFIIPAAHEQSTAERVGGATGNIVSFRQAPPGQPLRPYLARGPEVDRLSDLLSNLTKAKTEAEKKGELFDREGERQFLSRTVDQINRLENTILGGRQQRRLEPSRREPRDTALEAELRSIQRELAQQAIQAYREMR